MQTRPTDETLIIDETLDNEDNVEQTSTTASTSLQVESIILSLQCLVYGMGASNNLEAFSKAENMLIPWWPAFLCELIENCRSLANIILISNYLLLCARVLENFLRTSEIVRFGDVEPIEK